MRKFLVLLLATPLIAGCTSAPSATDLGSDCAGVSVFVNFSGEGQNIAKCVTPPAFAYWALWVKKSGSSEWEYATEGVGSLQLSAGDSVGLAFSLAGQTPTPEGK